MAELTPPTTPLSENGARQKKQYKARAPKPVLPDADLDRAINRDTAFVPPLSTKDSLEEQDDQQTALVKVGSLVKQAGLRGRSQESKYVFMMPIFIKRSGTHQMKFYAFPEEQRREEVEYNGIDWLSDNISADLFVSLAAKSRFSTKEERKKQHIKWLLFVWKHITRQPLPTDHATSKRRKRDTVVTDASDGEKAPPAKRLRHSGLLRPSKSANTSSERLPRNTSFDQLPRNKASPVIELWQQYNMAEFSGFDNPQAMKKLRQAYRKIYVGMPIPSVADLEKAYNERIATKVKKCTLTQAWFQFQEYTWGSSDTINVRVVPYHPRQPVSATFARTAKLPSPLTEGPKWKPLPKDLPSFSTASRIMEKWIERGRDVWDSEIDDVRVADFVLVRELDKRYRANAD